MTLREVAEAAGVSRSAVSRTFTEGASVSPRTRKKVEKAARELGYRPNFLARSLTTKRTALIGLLSNNFQNPAFMEVFDLFTAGLQERGLRPLLVNQSDEDDPQASLEMLMQYSVDGLIVASSTLPPQFSKALAETRLPVVHAFGKPSPPFKVNVVGIDNVHGGELAADLLIERGYRSVAFLGGPRTATSTEDRLAGFERRLGLAGIGLAQTRFAETYSYGAGRQAMTALLDQSPVEAVFCGDDILCMGARDVCRERGLRVPEEIGLIGFNDIAMADWTAYDLTTIRQPIRDIIIAAVELVVRLVEEPGRSAEARIFPCRAVERGTLRPL
ncbi:LacI family transcriptional regulator [Pelagibius litoralis]|uniref:LacI family transcriptional regulator n=1 Tax=Pelagibius litoralis TaxID=374515 RepID=A0A967K7D5_9PROT|nr:LacI family DNA-binding transcriptional regulator [Pelagibius litoralis]NIA69778.1 LacI family transcriptional regulator [Pelagibius litoralis]